MNKQLLDDLEAKSKVEIDEARTAIRIEAGSGPISERLHRFQKAQANITVAEQFLELIRLARIGLEHAEADPGVLEAAGVADLERRIKRMFEVIDTREKLVGDLASKPGMSTDAVRRLLDEIIETQTRTWDVFDIPTMRQTMQAALRAIRQPEAEPQAPPRAKELAEIDERLKKVIEIARRRASMLGAGPDAGRDSPTAMQAWNDDFARLERSIWQELDSWQMVSLMGAARFGLRFMEVPQGRLLALAALEEVDKHPIGPQEMTAIIHAVGDAVGRNVTPDAIFAFIESLPSPTPALPLPTLLHEIKRSPLPPDDLLEAFRSVNAAYERGAPVSEIIGGLNKVFSSEEDAEEGAADLETVQRDAREQLAMRAERKLRDWIRERRSRLNDDMQQSLSMLAYHILLLGVAEGDSIRPWRIVKLPPSELPVEGELMRHFSGKTYRFLGHGNDPYTKDTSFETGFFWYEPEHPGEGQVPFIRRQLELFQEVKNDKGEWVRRFSRL